MALVILGIASYNAEAQKKCVCPAAAKHATHKYVSHNRGVNKSKESYAQNFHICKDFCGYHVCGQNPTVNNTTPKSCARLLNGNNYAEGQNAAAYNTYTSVQPQATDMYTVAAEDYPAPTALNFMAPEQQSYPAVALTLRNANSFEGYYPNKGKIKVGYDNATAPYEGEASPQYDGPKKNKVRNLKANSPEQNSTDPSFTLPPSNGTIQKY